MLSKSPSCSKQQEKHHVLYVSNQPKFVGGAARSIFEILENLDRTRIKPFFASVHESEISESIQGVGVPFIRLHPPSTNVRVNFLTAAFQCRKFIKEYEIALIHNNQCIDALFTLLGAKLAGVPVVIHHRDLSYYRLERLMIRLADANIAISEWQNREILRNQCLVIHNGIVLQDFEPIYVKKKQETRSPKEKLVIGVVGRTTPAKGQDVFLKALRIVLENGCNLQAQIIGGPSDQASNNYYEKLISLTETLGITKQVKFRGHIEDKEKIWSRLDLLVVPSYKEPFGRVVIEGMACGIPVIGAATGGMLDIITPETGRLFPVGDYKALADTILKMAGKPASMEELGKEGRKRVEERFTIQKTLDSLYGVYNQLIG